MIKRSAILLLRGIAGIILVLLGLFALVTPFTPGSWLALIGLELLGLGFIWKAIKPYITRAILRKKNPSSAEQQEPPPSSP